LPNAVSMGLGGVGTSAAGGAGGFAPTIGNYHMLTALMAASHSAAGLQPPVGVPHGGGQGANANL